MTCLKNLLRILKRKTKQVFLHGIRLISRNSVYAGPCGYHSSSKVYFQSFEKSDIANYQIFLPEHSSYRKPPQSVYLSPHPKFESRYIHENPETFVLMLSAGRTLGTSGTIIAQDNKILADVSAQFGISPLLQNMHLHDAFNYWKFPVCEKRSETIAVLATAGGSEYFHWITDVLPKIHLLREVLSKDVKIDKYIINKGAPYISESLSMMNISSDLVISSHADLHLESSRMIVPSAVGTTGDPPGWVCEFLRRNFLPHKADVPSPSRLYVSRSKARYRKIVNEKAVVRYLKTIGFVPICLEDYDFPEQISLFANADFIVSPHGAGLTNLMWCNNKAKVLEIFSPEYVNVCFWAIANQIGLEYSYLLGEENLVNGSFKAKSSWANIFVSIEKLRQTMNSHSW